DRLPLRFSDRWITNQPLLQRAFPKFKVIRGNRFNGVGSQSERSDLAPDQAYQHLGQRRRDLGQVNGLKAISVRLKRRVSLGEKRSQDFDVILGSYLIRKLREIDLHLPAYGFPVLAGR